ncbi:ArnT family glycosyltransferase [Actinoplanes auranticolor]|uniref:Membrane protein n=1 Tax=Actinoplanes auranticolor TaxID=47988 RepID=A0A919SM19_9ACTN|nr:glycosyltransferase family 39 protein [Actinoplanes auranticolor]GIM73999.1 membrane protein [Actinoplanes auranticolor]
MSERDTARAGDQTAVLVMAPELRPAATAAQSGPPASPPVRPIVDVTVRAAWPALALYLGLRTFSILVLWLFAADRNRGLLDVLSRYDAVHYAGIVARGYDAAIPLKADGTLAITNLAFFPLFPGLTALADPILPGGPAGAGIAVSWLAGIAAAWGLFAIGAHLRDRRTGVLLAGLWAVLPHALVQSMGYTETLFTALAAWSLFALLRRHWLTAGLLCTLAGLTRPTGAALVAVIGLAALIAVIRRRDGWRPWLAGAIAPVGLLSYVIWVGHRLGRADGYFHVQKDAWKMSYDTGAFTAGTVHAALTKPAPLVIYTNILLLLLALALLAILILDRLPWPLVVYAGLIVAMAFFGDSYFNAKARLMVPAFPLLLPIAYALAAGRRRIAAVVLAALTLISAGYGVYLALAWTASP